MNTSQNRYPNPVNPALMVGAAVFWLIGALIVGVNGRAWFMPEAASAEADSIDTLFSVMLGIATFIFLMVETTLFYFVARYGLGRDQEDDTDSLPVHGNNTLEIAWTLAPAIIVFFLTIYSLQVLINTTEAKDDELEIDVQGQQFFWQFTYPDDEYKLQSNHVLVLPRDESVVLDMHSVDVIHAFWVPAFRVKQDVMPGRNTELRFTPTETTGLPEGESSESLIEEVSALQTEVNDLQSLLTAIDEAEAADQPLDNICPAEEETQPTEVANTDEANEPAPETVAGTSEGGDQPPVNDDNGFDIVCAELCGANHGLMRGEVYVVEPEEYEAYIARLRLRTQRDQLNQQKAIKCGGDAIKEAGRQIFATYGCNLCHQLNDAGSLNMGQGPSLNNVVADAVKYGGNEDPRDYIRTSIINPNAFIVPGYSPGIMPQNFIDRITEEELNLLVEYLALQTGE